MTLRRRGGRLLAVVDRDLLETDFVLYTSATVTPAVLVADVDDPLAASSVTSSGVLQWRRTGDSLVLLEYTGAAMWRRFAA